MLQLILCAAALSSPIEGLRQGTLDVGGTKLRLLVRLEKAAAGYSGTLTSPDQSPKPISITAVQIEAASIRITIGSIGAAFEGNVDASGAFDGKWKQGGAELPLRLTPTDEPTPKAVTARPQDPTRPLPYHEEDVVFASKQGGVRLAGTLTWPKTGAPVAAIALVTGSGPQDRDESIMGHKPFLVLADALTKRGVAVLRYDDRGIGKSTGDFATATTASFADDARGAVAFLRARSGIDPKRVGLGGHSEGAAVVGMVAAEDRELAFAVLLAPAAVPGDQILLSQVRAFSELAGSTSVQITQALEAQRQIMATIKVEQDPKKLDVELRRLVKKQTPEMSDAVLSAQVAQVTSPWFRFFLSYDPANAFKKTSVRVLALFGDKDLQVQARLNKPALENAFKTAGNKTARVVVMPGMNHLFQTATTGAPAEYGEIAETMAPAVMTLIGDFVVAR